MLAADRGRSGIAQICVSGWVGPDTHRIRIVVLLGHTVVPVASLVSCTMMHDTYKLSILRHAFGTRCASSLYWPYDSMLSERSCRYKALWSRATGLPDKAFFEATRSGFSDVLGKVHAPSYPSPGELAGTLVGADALRTAGLAGLVGIPEGTPVSAAVIDAHSAVPGVGVGDPNVMVLVLGTSSCYMVC